VKRHRREGILMEEKIKRQSQQIGMKLCAMEMTLRLYSWRATYIYE